MSLLLLALAAGINGCGEAPTQAMLNRCAGAAFTRANAAMARQWAVTNAAMKRRDAANGSRGGGFGYAAALLASQRAWLRFRDAECAIEGGEYAGGSAQAMTTAFCRARLTDARTAQLKSLEWRK
ncbi:lysozyme inhibitor LprI family protein [Sphingomonas jatrophae]|uniref:Uncharacterized conserved protein YecT, DUF1311 family n=1 Tax=Sphingomonas jatrophae TaxID=1166337 RepID=A0A1I6LIR4_9SPHN|nr:lysozyme inhibitor LprI family protein [Sphingomonas jatrophae]SFS03334.1 Uncharacterized conserved protein YecT, DUF1311 family [Sphingomonas jatrophae]